MSKKLLNIDIEIIKELKKNPKLSLYKLAKKLNLSHQTVKKHISLLEESGAIKYSLVLDKEYFGYLYVIDIFIWMDKNEINNFINICNENWKDNISYFSKHWDIGTISMQATFKSLNDLQNFIEELEKIEYIDKLEHNLVPVILFDNDSWSPKF